MYLGDSIASGIVMTHRWILCLGVSLSFAATPPNVQEIVKKSVGNTEANWNAAPQFDFMERDITTKKGRVEKTYRVTMIDGSPYNQLVAINGTSLGGSLA